MEMGEELLRSSDFPQECNEDKRIELAIKYFHEAAMNSCGDENKCKEEIEKIKSFSFDNTNIDEELDAPLSDTGFSPYTDPDEFYVALINNIYAEYLNDGERKNSTESIKWAYLRHCQATSDNPKECKDLLNADDLSPGIGPLARRNCNYLNDRIKNDGRRVGPYCPKCPPLP